MNIGIPTPDQSALFIIDVQERLMPVIYEQEQIIRNVNKLIKGAELLGVEIITTEQYPKGLGHTCQEVELPQQALVTEKECFSCLLSYPVIDWLNAKNRKHLILCGVESHICVLKTALDAIKEGYTVHVVADAVSSRTPENKQLALDRMRQSGAFIVSVEMILFMMLEKAGTDEFKAISRLIK